jgi:hypothetical protein
VHRSVDCGDTWEHISTGTGSDAIDGGRQWTFRINPRDGRIMYTNSGYYKLGLWKSYNGGKDWTEITPTGEGANGFAGDLQMDPDDPDHLLLTWHGPCYGVNHEFGYEDLVGCFHETKDGGRTWKAHYSQSGTKWQSEVRVLLLHGSTWIVLASNVLRTTDGGVTFSTVSNDALGGHSSGTLSRTRDGAYYVGTQFGAYRSAPGSDGQAWTSVGGQWVVDIADTGSKLYMMQAIGDTMSSAPADGVNWQAIGGTDPTHCGYAAYDAVRKALYATCGPGQLWRMTLQ